VSEVYEERQVVGIDVHRRRSVLVRMTETGDRLETVRIVNDPQRLAAVMARAGEAPEVRRRDDTDSPTGGHVAQPGRRRWSHAPTPLEPNPEESQLILSLPR
jgi:hypothetical protein